MESLAPHFKTIGQYLEGLAPHQDNWAVLGRFGAPNKGISLQVWLQNDSNKGISLEVWLQNDSSKISSTIFCPPLVFISIKSLFEDVPLWMMENNLDKLRSIEDKLNKVFIFNLQPIVLVRIYNLYTACCSLMKDVALWMGENQKQN